MLKHQLRHTVLLLPFLLGCPSLGPFPGIVSPDAFDSRYLRLRNLSAGYVVFRASVPDGEPLTTPVLPPGGLAYYEMLSNFGTLCPESIRLEIAAYERANPEASPLEDLSVAPVPYAAVGIEMHPTEDYGCVADTSWLSLDTTIECSAIEADADAGAVSFEAGWLPAQRQTGVQLVDPPVPTEPQVFPLHGRVVDSRGTPIPGVEIQLPLLQTSVLTDADGRFALPLPAGDYVIEPILADTEFSPLVHTFSHAAADEVPIEFVALTD